MSQCKITGDLMCKCKQKEGKVIVDFEAFRVALRRIFTDHAVYTSKVIESSVPVLQFDSKDNIDRVLENPGHIRFLVEPFLGVAAGEKVEALFTEHLKLAAATLEPVRLGNKKATAAAVAKFMEQGVQVGMLIGSINSKKLNKEQAIQEFSTHNEFVVKLATLRSQRKSKEYNETYDFYFNHMMELSDSIANALVC